METTKTTFYRPTNIWADIRRYCIDNNLFTHGSNFNYNKMFDMAYDKYIPHVAIASIIYACSETNLSLDDIEDKIEDIREILYIED